MGNLLSPTSNQVVERLLLDATPTEWSNLLFDLPFNVAQDICTKWLADGSVLPKSLIKLDTALHDRIARGVLLQVYKTINLSEFMLSEPALVYQKMKWTLDRQIPFTELMLTEVENRRTTREFFKYNGPTLKLLHICGNHAMTPMISEYVAKYCKHLEALCIEDCPLHIVIGAAINRCPLRRLRLKSPFENGSVPSKVISPIRCPTVTELSLLDKVDLKRLPIVTAAFPNVQDFEMIGFGVRDNAQALLSALFQAWPNLHTLRMHYAYIATNAVWPLNPQQCTNLRKICFLKQVDCDANALIQFLTDCASLTSITIRSPHLVIPIHTPEHYVRIIECMNSRLEEFCIGDAYFDSSVLVALAQHCPNLRILEVTNMNEENSDRSMVDVYKQCPLLEQLHISINYARSEGLMQYILPHTVGICTHFISLSQSMYRGEML